MSNKENQSVASSAGKVSLATAISRILGLVREQVQAYFFGAGMMTDAFVAAFRIPNLLRDLFAEGALSSAFVPVFKEKIVNRGKEEAFRLANLTISNLVLVVGGTVALGIIFTPALIFISAKGFYDDPAKFALTVNLTRIMFVFLLMVSVSAVQMGILNSCGRFGVPALAPTLFNAGMILAPVLLYSYFEVPIYTMAIGVLLGGLGQILFQVPSLRKVGYRFKFQADFKDEGIAKINHLISPMILGLSASRINILVSTLLASLLAEGAMSYLNYAYRLMHFPLGVFGVALGTAALPRVSEQVASRREDLLVNTFHEAVCLSSFLVVPSAVYLAGFGNDLVRLIYERGAFDAAATTNTAQALLFYSFGLVGFAGVRVAAPVFYALGDARRPMIYSLVSVGINIVLNFALIPLWGFAGLAAATSASGLVNFLQLILSLRRQIPAVDIRFIAVHFLKVAVAALVAFISARFIPIESWFTVTGLAGKISTVTAQIAVMGIIYLVVLKILKVQEVGRLLSYLKRLLRK